MIKRLIFDVDGTLITGVSFSQAILTTLQKMNIYTDDCVKLFLEAISLYEEKYNNYNKEDYLNHFSQILGVELNDDFFKIFFEELKKCVPLNNEKLIKPNNESYLQACGPHMPSECVMIGDDLYLDIMKSKEMGLNAIFVNSKNIYDYIKVINNMDELKKILEI